MKGTPSRQQVVYSTPIWLPQTMTWLHTQAVCLPISVEVHVVCESTANLDQFHMPYLHALSSEPGWRQFLNRGLRKLGIRQHIDLLSEQLTRTGASLLHSHFGNVGWADMEAARRHRIPHIVTFYGYDVGMLPQQDAAWKSRYQAMFKHIDLVLCEGSYMAGSIERLGCPREKLQVHHLGIRLNEIPFAPRAWTPGTPLRVLLAGSFTEKKGFPYALEALGFLKNKLPLEITIIGDANQNPRFIAEKQRILEVIDRSGLGPYTQMMGYQPHATLFEEAYKHHIFLSPSVTASDGDSEGGAPVTIIEMVATGMPVISTNHCDISEVILEGQTGWLAPERDVAGLLEVFERWLSAPELWSDMLAEGRRHVEAEYDAQTQGWRLADIYARFR